MSWVAGVDADSFAIHCVFVDEDDVLPPEYHCWPLTGHDAWERTRTVRQALPRHMFGDVLAVGVENPAGRAGTGLYAVLRVVGAVLTCLPAEVLVQPWRPSEWRKAVGLPGNCDKESVRDLAVVHSGSLFTNNPYSIDDWPQDACDAYCVAVATRNAITVEAAA